MAAVDGRRRCTVTEDIRRAPQQDASMRTAIGNRWTHIHPFHREKTSTFSGGGLCWHYLFSRSVTRQLSSAHVCLTSVFGLGSDGSAASGGRSDLSEWQRSTGDEGAPSPRISVGHRNRKQVDPSILFTGIKEPPPCWTEVIIMFALPIFTASHPATIVGVHVLNFCVRDGNRWTHMTINTNLLTW